MSILKKVKTWAEAKQGESRYVSGDANVTYEDILKVCEMATPVVPKKSIKNKEVKDVDNGLVD